MVWDGMAWGSGACRLRPHAMAANALIVEVKATCD